MHGSTLKTLLELSGCVLKLGARREHDDGHYSLGISILVRGVSHSFVVRSVGVPSAPGRRQFETVWNNSYHSSLMLSDRDVIKLARHLHGDSDRSPVLDTVPVSHILEGAYFSKGEYSYLRVTHTSAVEAGLDLTGWPVWGVCVEGDRSGILSGFGAGEMVLPGGRLHE